MENKKLFRILSIDGGGIRGIIPGQVLVSLEKKIQKKTKNPNARIADYFDLIAGTSTGGILSIAYLCPHLNDQTRPKFNAEEVVNLYLEKGGEIFSIPFKHKIKSGAGIFDEKYPAENFEKALQAYFGETKLSQLLKPCLVTAYDIKRRKGQFFTQHDAKKDKAWDYLVRDVARATSAAPTYFECSNIKSETGVQYPLIDGGVFVNNPTLCAYAEAVSKFKVTAKDMAILSIGTGFVRDPYEYKKAKDWGAAQWIKPIIDIMMSGVADAVDYQLKQMYDAVEKPSQYLRVNTEMPSDVNSSMDDASEKNLLGLKALGTETAQNHSQQLDKFIELIIQ